MKNERGEKRGEMKILAIESAARTASVAILAEDVIIGEYTTNHKLTHSQMLLPIIDEVCVRTETALESLDAIAISAGPGSFTGLRIGSATAKGLGLALDKPLIEVPTLEGLAYNMACAAGLVCPMMDARRNHVYGAVYEFEDGLLKERMGPVLAAVPDFIETIGKMGKNVIFLGDGAEAAKTCIEEKADFAHVFAPASMCTHRAASVAVAAAIRYRAGKVISPDEHAPDYLRPSQAERELAKKGRAADDLSNGGKAGS